MASLDMVEKLRTRADITYEDAREALDSSEGDMLDALIWLEKNGKITPPRVAYYSTDEYASGGSGSYSAGDIGAKHDGKHEKSDRYYDARKSHKKSDETKSKERGYEKASHKKNRGSHRSSYYYDRESGSRAYTHMKSAAGYFGKAFNIGNTTMFEIKRYGRDIIKIPLTLLVIAFILFFQVVMILLPLGLFFGFRYRLDGEHFESSPVNAIMSTIADAVDGIKEAFGKNKRN